jgi:hypothetical protein
MTKGSKMTTEQLCKSLNISHTTAIRWASEGCPHRRTPKEAFRWDLKTVEAWRAATIKSPAPADPDFLKSRARKEHALAEKHELDVATRKGQLLDKTKANRSVFEIFRQTRDSFLALPDRLAGILAAESDQHACHTLISDECRRILEDLATRVERMTDEDAA